MSSGDITLTPPKGASRRISSVSRELLRSALGLAILLVPVLALSGSNYWLNILAYAFLFGGLALAWNIIGGFGGPIGVACCGLPLDVLAAPTAPTAAALRASAAEEGRRPWSRWATTRRRPRERDSSWRPTRRARESGPPEQATSSGRPPSGRGFDSSRQKYPRGRRWLRRVLML